MGITLCDKHEGRQGITHVSPGVLNAMEVNDAEGIICVAFLAKDGEKIFDYCLNLHMKNNELGSPPFTGVFDEKRRAMIFNDDEHISKTFCMFIPVCGACFREFMGTGMSLLQNPDLSGLDLI
jgi:hypothetical protein